jgi:hypothetical protein
MNKTNEIYSNSVFCALFLTCVYSHIMTYVDCHTAYLKIYFYLPATNPDFSQSTSNIPLVTGSDSSPDSTPGLPRRLELKQGYANSAEQVW